MKNNYSSFAQYIEESFRGMNLLPVNKYITINNLTIRFSFFNEELSEMFMKSFRHIESEPTEDFCFTLNICDQKSLGFNFSYNMIIDEDVDMADNQNLFFSNDNIHMLHNTLTSIMTLVDLNTCQAYYCIKSIHKVPDYEKAAPFRMFFHWFCIKFNMSLIHGAVLGIKGNGFLLAGRGGSGKSTLSLLSSLNGNTFLGDDYVIIENCDNPKAFSLYNSIKVNEDIINRYPFIHHYIANRDSTNYEKGFLYADSLPNVDIAGKIQLKGIIMLSDSKSDLPSIKKIPGLKALSVIGSSTIFQMPGINRDFLVKLTKIIRSMPVFEFVLGHSIENNKEYLLEFIDVNPLVSIVLPVYNGEKYLKASIGSVLRQTHQNFELIVVDDGSTDRTESLVQHISDKRLKYLYQENRGPAAARNTGINHSEGRYIAFLDYDDEWYDEKLERQLYYLRDRNGIRVLFSKHKLVFEKSEKNYPWMRKISNESRYVYEIPSSMFTRRSIFNRIGVFNPMYKTAEDSDLLLRIRDAGIKYEVMDDILFNKNIHDNNISSNITSNRKYIPLLLSESIKRRKKLSDIKISVIIPAYNPDRHMVSCLKSVLAQTLPPYEIIIADDGSKNNVRELISDIKDDRIKLYKQENKGISGARNLGIKHATGNYFAFIDSDDIWTDDKLEKQTERIIADSTVNAVFSYVRQFYSREVNEDYRNKYRFKDAPSKGMISGTMFISREDFLKVGLFNESLRLGELFDWIHRFNNLGFHYVVLNDVMMYRRLHYNNNGILRKEDRVDFAKAFAQIVRDKKKNGKN